jgi:acetylcholinesterase
MGKPIIFVSINYRTAAGGFLDSEELRREGNTNNGLYDQRLALEFVHENIESFGGDKGKVTIWGER